MEGFWKVSRLKPITPLAFCCCCCCCSLPRHTCHRYVRNWKKKKSASCLKMWEFQVYTRSPFPSGVSEVKAFVGLVSKKWIGHKTSNQSMESVRQVYSITITKTLSIIIQSLNTIFFHCPVDYNKKMDEYRYFRKRKTLSLGISLRGSVLSQCSDNRTT